MSPRRLCRAGWFLAGACVIASAAHAVDGVIEINQARAVAGGVTPDDTPGFPVTISQAGSYRLTGNLDVTGEASPENATAIVITASFVTLDLNGFALVGPTACTGTPVTSCAPLGGGIGILSATANFVTVANGAIRGFGLHGIHAANATIDDLRASNNGGTGIWLESGGEVRRSRSSANGHDGIAGGGVLVSHSQAQGNALSGIYLVPGQARESLASNNGVFGISVGAGLAFECHAGDNGGCAINAEGGGYARNVANGPQTLCGGIELGSNLCNGGGCP